MSTLSVIVVWAAIVANGFSGIAALVHFKPILPGMAAAGVPVSWLTFPIGTLKTLGALGLLGGMLVSPPIAVAAAGGLVIFFVCALYTHVLARDLSAQFGLAAFLLALNAATLWSTITWL